MSNPLHFVIVADRPIYSASLSQLPGTSPPASTSALRTLLLHSSLDLVDRTKWTTSSMNLKIVDTSPNGVVSAFVTAGDARFLLLHGGATDESVKNFFNDVYEEFTRYILNPLVESDQVVTSKSFDTRVRAIARRYLS